MRSPRFVVVFVMVVASLSGVAGRATACRVCDPSLHCIMLNPGAVSCVEGPGACAMFLQCFGAGGKRLPDGSAEFLTAWSLFDAPAGTGFPSRAPSLQAEVGDIALGEEARAFTGGAGPVGTLADAALAFGDEFALSFVDDVGDGFAIQRSEEGGRVRLEVREVTGDLPGRVLASEALGPRDQLRVPVRVEGRDRVLLLQAADVHGGNGPFEVARLRRGLASASRTLPVRSEPLLRAHAR